MQASYIAMAAALEEEGCDLFLIETCARISVAQAALAACRWVNPSKTVWLAMTLQDTKPVLWSGETVAELVATFDSPGGEDGAESAPDAILFNCSPPEVVHAALLELRPIFAGRTGGYANRRGGA
jgi:S-methylmethionine-dependent homocysteine/selenocysteine methylase